MLLILPIAAFILFYLNLRAKDRDWRTAILGSAVLWGTSVVVITEVLSVPNLISRTGVALSWLAICILAYAYLRKTRRFFPSAPDSAGATVEPLDSVTKGLIAATGFMILVIGITAVISPPNVWDAMEYHLPRVMMWMSNHNVRFFPTPNYAQLIFGPWAEYAMMHTYLLWGSDRLINLIEFFSMLGSLVAVSLIAKLFGAGARGQALAAIVCATITEGALEASGPMNGYIVTFWITTTVAFLMIWNDDSIWLNTILIGLSAGLAILTKGTAYVYLPFLVLACWWMGSTAIRIRFLKRSAVLLLLIFAINGPTFFRCYQLTGSPLGLPFPDAGPTLRWRVDRISAKGILANSIRNLSLQLITPIPAINERIERVVRETIRGIGADPDDPQTIWPGMPYQLGNLSSHEIHANNPLQLGLLLLSFVFLAWKGKDDPRFRQIVCYALGMVGAFLLFSTMLRWQIWGSRHQLTIFVLGSVLIALVITRYFSRPIANVVVICLIAYTFCFTLVNRTRSLIPWSRVDDIYHQRSILYFSDHNESIAAANIAAADALNRTDCRNIAIDSYMPVPQLRMFFSPKSFYVYPFLALVHADGRNRSVWYAGEENRSVRYANQESHPPPCAVVCFDCAKVSKKWDSYRDVGGRASVFDYIVVFSADGNIPNVAGSGNSANNLPGALN